jgi:hypothetical protein
MALRFFLPPPDESLWLAAVSVIVYLASSFSAGRLGREG